jgi:hypothetical protein
MDSEGRAVIWQWVIGAGVIALAAAAATYTPSMPEGPSAEPSNAPAPRLSQLLPASGLGTGDIRPVPETDFERAANYARLE